MKLNKVFFKKVIEIVVTILTAIATTLGTISCAGV